MQKVFCCFGYPNTILMKLVFSTLLSVFLCFSISAQVTTNIYWTEQTDMSKPNTIYYHADQKLGWDDFKGMPGPPSPVAAITASGFGYKANMNASNRKAEINVAVYCYFNKKGSWVRQGKTSSYILNHEQHHFDVSYLAAGIFINKLKNTVITTSNCNMVVPKIYKECCDMMNKMQDDYDKQTMNGQLEDKQKKWNNFFAEKLPLITK